MKMLNALLLLKEQVTNGSVLKPFSGICHNLSEMTGDVTKTYEFVRDNCFDWCFFSGINTYPVENCNDEPLWEGKQLELRLSLINHLIAKAKILQV